MIRGVNRHDFDPDHGWAVPKEYIEPANQGIQGAMQSGVIDGYPVVEDVYKRQGSSPCRGIV